MTLHANFETFTCLDAVPDDGRHDPLGVDLVADLPVVTTERRLRRLAIVACDVGARFVRDAVMHDPVAWMLSPLRCLEGERPLDACQSLDGFLRATLLNGLSLGLDASSDALDALSGEGDLPIDAIIPDGVEAEPAPRMLFTAAISGPVGWGGQELIAFVAMTAPDLTSFRRRLVARFGETLVGTATIERGFDSTRGRARELVSPASLRLVAIALVDPDGPVGAGLDIHGERRFDA